MDRRYGRSEAGRTVLTRAATIRHFLRIFDSFSFNNLNKNHNLINQFISVLIQPESSFSTTTENQLIKKEFLINNPAENWGFNSSHDSLLCAKIRVS